MNESDFWWELSVILNRMDGRIPSGYCDGFVPKRYVFAGEQSYASGSVFFLGGSHGLEYAFKLPLGPDADCLEEIDWVRLLPRESSTDLWTVDVENGRIEFFPREIGL